MQTAGSDGGGCPCGGTYTSPTSDLSMRWKNSLTPYALLSFFPHPHSGEESLKIEEK